MLIMFMMFIIMMVILKFVIHRRVRWYFNINKLFNILVHKRDQFFHLILIIIIIFNILTFTFTVLMPTILTPTIIFLIIILLSFSSLSCLLFSDLLSPSPFKQNIIYKSL